MKTLSGLLSVPLLCAALVGLAGCGNSTDAPPLKPQVLGAPARTPAQAMKPFSFGEYTASWTHGGSCSWESGHGILLANTVTVARPLTVTSFDPLQNEGLLFDTPTYARQPATVEGHSNTAFGGGSFNGTAPSQAQDVRTNIVAALNWRNREPVVGARLQPGTTYFLFQPMWRSPQDGPQGGSVQGWTIGWKDASGHTGTSTWRDPITLATSSKGC